MSHQAAAENGQAGSSSYGDGEIVPPLGSEGGEALQLGRARASCMGQSQNFEMDPSSNW